MRKILIVTLIFIFTYSLSGGILFAQLINNLNLIKNYNVRPNQPETVLNSKYAAIWGWTSPQGREYAILCCVTGTSFIDVTDTFSIYENDFILNYLTINRECKTYLNYAYVTSDAYGQDWSGLQIIDLRYLPDSTHLIKNWTFGNFKFAHTLYQEIVIYTCVEVIPYTDMSEPM